MEKTHMREKKDVHKFERRAGWNDDHHIDIPSSRGGEKIDSNILLMDVYRHDAWHLLFSNKTLKEIINTFQVIKSVKEFLHSIIDYYKHQAFHLLFGNKSLDEVLALLLRVQKIKRAQRVYLRISA